MGACGAFVWLLLTHTKSAAKFWGKILNVKIKVCEQNTYIKFMPHYSAKQLSKVLFLSRNNSICWSWSKGRFLLENEIVRNPKFVY